MTPAAQSLYTRILRPILFRLDAETAHRITLTLLSALPALPRPADPPELGVKLWNIAFSNPVGLAAGMDKDALAVRAWEALGFGFAELGTITPRSQPGNPVPRLWRLPEHGALINRLGFPSAGMERVAPRIARLRQKGVGLRLGLNFGPNRDTPPERVAGDCSALMVKLGPMADFVVVNVSSPNTPGLRDWQAPERMRSLVEAVASAWTLPSGRPPILVKLAPDLEQPATAAICQAALAIGLDGIVACNTTLSREGIGITPRMEGGLSGQPLKMRARALIADVYRHTEGKLPIIGVGGIASAEDAYGHIRAGASLVELYTGMIYHGPGLPGAIKAGLVQLLRQDGWRSISEAVGRGA
jgi:dihydroorotate dehydrogenase